MAQSQQLVLTADTLNRSEHELGIAGVGQLRSFLGLDPV
jgi:hypothetical protein